MCLKLILILLFLLIIFYLYQKNNEQFRNLNSKSNIYESIGLVPSKLLYLSPPTPTEPNVDYQDWLNEVSGYDSGTRGYYNPVYAADVAAGLDTN